MEDVYTYVPHMTSLALTMQQGALIVLLSLVKINNLTCKLIKTDAKEQNNVSKYSSIRSDLSKIKENVALGNFCNYQVTAWDCRDQMHTL